jgi:hypothetical protein
MRKVVSESIGNLRYWSSNPFLGRRFIRWLDHRFQLAQQVIIQVWISTHFGVLSEQLPDADENSLFIKPTFTPAPVPL